MRLSKAAVTLTTLIRIVISKPDGLRVQEKWEEMSPRLDSGKPVALPGFMKDICLGFTGTDVGSVGIKGCTEAQKDSVVHINRALTVLYTGPFEVKGSGAGIGGSQDHFHFFRGPIPLWNIDLVTEVTNLSGDGHQAGVMVRSSLDSGSKHFSLFVKSDGTLVRATRTDDNGGTSIHTVSPESTNIRRQQCQFTEWRKVFRWWFPVRTSLECTLTDVKVWLRVEKQLQPKKFIWGHFFQDSDYRFRSYHKINESDEWIEVGSSKILKQHAADDFVGGVAVTSNDNAELALLNLSKVKIISFGNADEALQSSTLDVESCAPSARKLRLQLSSPVDNIDAIEFYATSAELDTVSNPPERHLIESTVLKDIWLGLELDLGTSYSIDSVSVVGSKCIDSYEPSCLCQLVGATISLVGDSGEDIISMDIGNDVCDKSHLNYTLDTSPEFCVSSELMRLTGEHAVPAPAPAKQNIPSPFGQKQRKMGSRPRRC